MDGEGMQLSCTLYFKGSKKYINISDVLKKKSSIKALNIVFELDWQKSEVSSLKRKNTRFF